MALVTVRQCDRCKSLIQSQDEYEDDENRSPFLKISFGGMETEYFDVCFHCRTTVNNLVKNIINPSKPLTTKRREIDIEEEVPPDLPRGPFRTTVRRDDSWNDIRPEPEPGRGTRAVRTTSYDVGVSDDE